MNSQNVLLIWQWTDLDSSWYVGIGCSNGLENLHTWGSKTGNHCGSNNLTKWTHMIMNSPNVLLIWQWTDPDSSWYVGIGCSNGLENLHMWGSKTGNHSGSNNLTKWTHMIMNSPNVLLIWQWTDPDSSWYRGCSSGLENVREVGNQDWQPLWLK